MATLEIRTELFDHWVYPNQAKITEQSLLTLFKSLNILSSVKYKISIFQWIEQALKHIPTMTVTEAETYFKTYTILLSKIELEHNDLDEDEEKKIEDPSTIENVDVRWFALFMLIQLFTHTAKDYTVTHNNYTNTAWPGAKGNNQNSPGSAIASPRSKATKVNYTSSASSIILHFVKTNLRMLLKLISSEIHKKEDIKLSKNEVDTLRVLMRIHQDSSAKGSSISQICELFRDSSKVPLIDVYNWISNNLSDNEPDYELNIKNLTYCVTTRDSETLAGKHVRLQDWEDWYIYLDSAISSLWVLNCTNCTIMVAACRMACTIDKWEKTQVSVASNFVRIGNSIDWTVYCYSGNNVPIMFGDNKNITMGPHNVGYSNIMDHFKEAQVPVHTSNVKNFSKPVLANGDKSTYSVLEEADFFKLVMPKTFTDSMLLLTPQNYIDAITKRMEIFGMIQDKISSSNLNSEQEKMLHVAIQGYFREWLVTNNNHKKINELIRLIDQ